jgi:hypothetical protein
LTARYTGVADGKVDVGLVPISEAKAAPSVEYAGPLAVLTVPLHLGLPSRLRRQHQDEPTDLR